jgi:GT2 family glycosyltransferase
MERPLMPRSPVTVVIPVWNQWNLTSRCLDSLRPAMGPRDQVVVIDNGSVDQTAVGLAGYRWAEVITNPTNRGFAAACNQGAAWRPSRGEPADIVLFLNNDTLVPVRSLDALVEPFSDLEVGATGPRSNSVSGPQLVAEVPYLSGASGRSGAAGRSGPAGVDNAALRSFARTWQRRHVGQVTAHHRLVGFALAVRRSAFEAVGGFDESFGLGGCEDDDLCARLEADGWRLLIAHGSYIHHHGHATFDANSVDWFALQQTNARRFEAKHGVGLGSPLLRLSACMIVRDEEELLAACLASVDGIADEVVIYDTGSSDRSIQIATAAGAKVIEGYWDDDFARARNEALAACHGRWVLHIDADEVLDTDRAVLWTSLDRAGPEVDVLMLEIVNLRGDGTAPRDHQRGLRLFRRERAVWRQPLHEQLELRPGQAGTLGAYFLPGTRIIHSGYLDEVVSGRDKWARNLRLAERALSSSTEEQGQLRGEAELNVGRALTDVGRPAEGIEHLERAVAMLVSPMGRRFALTFGTHVLLNLNRPQDALVWIGQLRAMSSRTDLVDFLEGSALRVLGRSAEALPLFERVVDLVDEDGFRPQGGTLESALAGLYSELEMWPEAADACLRVLVLDCTPTKFIEAAEACFRSGRELEDLAAAVSESHLTVISGALAAMNPEGADLIADALWVRFGMQPAVLAAAALFAPRIPALRALRWSSRLREANSAQHCPLIARARLDAVDPVERARSAVLAFAAFADPRSIAILHEVLHLLDDRTRADLAADVAKIAPDLVSMVLGAELDAGADREQMLPGSGRRVAINEGAT